jgi:hypothetical protein
MSGRTAWSALVHAGRALEPQPGEPPDAPRRLRIRAWPGCLQYGGFVCIEGRFRRGLCAHHWRARRADVAARKVTWKELQEAGQALSPGEQRRFAMNPKRQKTGGERQCERASIQ